jgi:hypothetical protein
MRFLSLALVGLSLFSATSAFAKTFQNSYVRFEIPENWHCGQENLAWVCSPVSSKDAREALIVVTAKVAGPEDNLDAYERHLKKPKTLATRGAKTGSFSTVLSTNHRTINGVNWVEAVHLGSEVPEFHTEYLAVVKENLAILISLSADNEQLGKYEQIFKKAVNSLHVDLAKAAPEIAKAQGAAGPNVVNQNAAPQAKSDVAATATDTTTHARNRKSMSLLVGVLALLVIGLVARKFL